MSCCDGAPVVDGNVFEVAHSESAAAPWRSAWPESASRGETGTEATTDTGDSRPVNVIPDSLDCDGEPDESCSITNPDQGDPMLALVFLVLLGLRRRDGSAETRAPDHIP